MMIIELTEDKFGRAMKDISCIEEKLEGIKDIFEAEAMGYRKHRGEEREYMDRDRDYRESRRERPYGRYE